MVGGKRLDIPETRLGGPDTRSLQIIPQARVVLHEPPETEVVHRRRLAAQRLVAERVAFVHVWAGAGHGGAAARRTSSLALGMLCEMGEDARVVGWKVVQLPVGSSCVDIVKRVAQNVWKGSSLGNTMGRDRRRAACALARDRSHFRKQQEALPEDSLRTIKPALSAGPRLAASTPPTRVPARGKACGGSLSDSRLGAAGRLRDARAYCDRACGGVHVTYALQSASAEGGSSLHDAGGGAMSASVGYLRAR